MNECFHHYQFQIELKKAKLQPQKFSGNYRNFSKCFMGRICKTVKVTSSLGNSICSTQSSFYIYILFSLPQKIQISSVSVFSFSFLLFFARLITEISLRSLFFLVFNILFFLFLWHWSHQAWELFLVWYSFFLLCHST